MKAEVLKGHLDGLLLATLEAGPRHGYAIIDAVRTSSAGRIHLPTGTVYPALHRLERAGLVTSSWSVGQARPRRTYRLTPAGRRALGTERTAWQEFANAVTAVLQPSQPSPQPTSP